MPADRSSPVLAGFSGPRVLNPPTLVDGFYLLLSVLLFCAGTLFGIPHGLAKRSGDIKRIEF
jgi:hypothetical protein